MKITPAQFDVIHNAIQRSKGAGVTPTPSQGVAVTTTPAVDAVSHVDIASLAEQLDVQYRVAKSMLYQAAKYMGFAPTRAGTVSGEGALPLTAKQKHLRKMLAAAASLMAEYDADVAKM